MQRSPEGIVHLVAERLADRSGDLALLSQDAPIDEARDEELREWIERKKASFPDSNV